jgi:hypothetical protein
MGARQSKELPNRKQIETARAPLELDLSRPSFGDRGKFADAVKELLTQEPYRHLVDPTVTAAFAPGAAGTKEAADLLSKLVGFATRLGLEVEVKLCIREKESSVEWTSQYPRLLLELARASSLPADFGYRVSYMKDHGPWDGGLTYYGTNKKFDINKLGAELEDIRRMDTDS